MYFRCGCWVTASTSGCRPLLPQLTRGGHFATAAARGAVRRFSLSGALRKNHYDTLGVKQSATPAEVKSSFYALSRQWHPDKQGGSRDATQKFQEIAEAYGVLSDDAKRRDYDLAHGLRPGGARGTGSNAFSSEQYWRRHHANHQQQQQQQPWRNPFENPFGNGSVPPHMRQKYRQRSQFNFDEWYQQHYGNDPEKRRTNNASDAFGRRHRSARPQQDKMTQAQEIRARLVALIVVIFIYSTFSRISRYDRHGGGAVY